jgi:TonB family protein
MPVQEEELERKVSGPSTPVSSAPSSYAGDHLDRLLVSEVEIPWYRSFIDNILSVFRPEKLPPLEVTSKPVAVKDIWGRSGNKRFAGVTSLAIHAGVIGLLLFLGTNKVVQQTVKETVTLIAPSLEPFPAMAKKPDQMGGGGGGGDRSPLPASQGKLPKIAPRQFTPPAAVVNNPNPKLVMEPTIVVQPDAPLPQIASNTFGDPLSRIQGPPSNGIGSGGGIGSGSGGGVGSGRGPGVGPGSGGGFGGGAYKIGGGVSEPIPIYKPEPEYSEEARKAKFQGVVLLEIVIDEQGRTRNARVAKPLGLGLDEKAIEAVMKWRFRPSLKDGSPVPVRAFVEVNFRLL